MPPLVHLVWIMAAVVLGMAALLYIAQHVEIR